MCMKRLCELFKKIYHSVIKDSEQSFLHMKRLKKQALYLNQIHKMATELKRNLQKRQIVFLLGLLPYFI